MCERRSVCGHVLLVVCLSEDRALTMIGTSQNSLALHDALSVSVGAVPHSPEVYDDPMAFDPGRFLGDGGLCGNVTDIAGRPAYQGKGLGRKIMENLMAWAETELPASTYISLIADVPANKVYEKFGFKETAPRSVGMARRAGTYA